MSLYDAAYAVLTLTAVLLAMAIMALVARDKVAMTVLAITAIISGAIFIPLNSALNEEQARERCAGGLPVPGSPSYCYSGEQPPAVLEGGASCTNGQAVVLMEPYRSDVWVCPAPESKVYPRSYQW